MNDERYCCDGDCNQGKDCPRYRSKTEDDILILIKAVAVIVFMSIVAGYLWASFGG